MSQKPYVKVVQRRTGSVLVESARWCQSWLCKLRGFQFHRRLAPGEALILVEKKETIASSSIHMFFVFFPIAAIWVNEQGRVTSAQLARPWRPFYASPQPARYVLEAEPSLLEKVSVGDEIDFV